MSTPEKSDKLGHFHTLPHLMKLYEVAKGAFKTYQVTLFSFTKEANELLFDLKILLSDESQKY